MKGSEKYWDEAVETLNPDSRYNRWIDCWIFKKGSIVPSYLKEEQKQGRVLVMP